LVGGRDRKKGKGWDQIQVNLRNNNNKKDKNEVK